jgi:hypothetical protein
MSAGIHGPEWLLASLALITRCCNDRPVDCQVVRRPLRRGLVEGDELFSGHLGCGIGRAGSRRCLKPRRLGKIEALGEREISSATFGKGVYGRVEVTYTG